MIKWCLHLKFCSSFSYDVLRRSECLTLPFERTLWDYTRHFKAGVAFQVQVDEQLLSETNIANIEERQKYIVLLTDETNIKEDLVYNKGKGELIRFTNIGDINNHLDIFETALANTVRKEPQLATSMLVYG